MLHGVALWVWFCCVGRCCVVAGLWCCFVVRSCTVVVVWCGCVVVFLWHSGIAALLFSIQFPHFSTLSLPLSLPLPLPHKLLETAFVVALAVKFWS